MQHPQRSTAVQRATFSGELRQLEADRQADDTGEARGTVLVVENEENNRCLMEQVLGLAGYHAISATNGLEALEVLDREPVDLVLIDLSMPVLDGYRTTEIIRQRPNWSTLPIVAVSAHAMSEDREQALGCGCTDYLAKPYRPTELISLVERLLHPHDAPESGER
jgi:CheY-like chemotaxis protein